MLKMGDKLFSFPKSAGCMLKEAEVHTPLEEGDDHDKHDDHDEKGEEHHSEFHAHYHFACKNPAALSYMDTTFFSTFKAAHEIDVQAILPKGQTAKELTANATRLMF